MRKESNVLNAFFTNFERCTQAYKEGTDEDEDDDDEEEGALPEPFRVRSIDPLR